MIKFIEANQDNVVSLYVQTGFVFYSINVKYHKDTGLHTTTLQGLDYTRSNLEHVIKNLETYLDCLKRAVSEFPKDNTDDAA